MYIRIKNFALLKSYIKAKIKQKDVTDKFWIKFDKIGELQYFEQIQYRLTKVCEKNVNWVTASVSRNKNYYKSGKNHQDTKTNKIN